MGSIPMAEGEGARLRILCTRSDEGVVERSSRPMNLKSSLLQNL